MKTPIELTAEKFQEIYTSEKFRNEVAYAHGCLDSNHKFKYYNTYSYPVRYIVTKEQIEEAKAEIERVKPIVSRENRNKLLFVAMGCDFEAKEGFINNHRIRTEFKNLEGKTYFIEVGTARNNNEMRCDHSVDRNLEHKFNDRSNKYFAMYKEEKQKPIKDQNKITSLLESSRKYQAQPYYNYKGLERAKLGLYTYDNLLSIVNDNFNCAFTEIVIDYYNISCDGVICESPKEQLTSKN